MSPERMLCAECGREIAGVPCCSGAGYWYNRPPLATELFKPACRNGFWLYVNPTRWPRGKKAIKP